jgi:multicomponent Na+:H+ antiporter subunit B
MNLNFFEKFTLKLATSFILLISIVLSLNIHIFGKISAGGGFQAGALLASGIIIFEFCNEVRLISKYYLNILTFVGLSVYFATGIASFFLNGSLFEYSTFHPEYGHIIGSFCVETAVLFVVTSAMLRISHLISKN